MAVTQAIPTPMLRVIFRLEDWLCVDWNSMVSRFWWSQHHQHRTLPWFSRINVHMTSKQKGGMDFIYLKTFNVANLVTQKLRLIHNKISYLVYKTLTFAGFKRGYVRNLTLNLFFFQIKIGSTLSSGWSQDHLDLEKKIIIYKF